MDKKHLIVVIVFCFVFGYGLSSIIRDTIQIKNAEIKYQELVQSNQKEYKEYLEIEEAINQEWVRLTAEYNKETIQGMEK